MKYKQITLKLLLLIMAIIFILPFIIMISTSFEYFTFSLPFPPRLIPKEVVLDNYIEVITTQNIFKYFSNSVIITIISAVCVMGISSMAAYAFARLEFRTREAIFKLFLFTLMIPGVLNIIPQYIIIKNIGLIGKRTGLLVLYLGTGVAGSSFFLRSFFESIPKSIDEAIRIDGGNHWTIYSRIYLPLSKAGLATMGFLVIQGTWEDFFTAKVMLGGNEKVLTLPIMLHRLSGQHSTKFGLIFAASIITLIPVMILYVIFQRKFVVGGAMQGSVKF